MAVPVRHAAEHTIDKNQVSLFRRYIKSTDDLADAFLSVQFYVNRIMVRSIRQVFCEPRIEFEGNFQITVIP